MVNRRYSIRSRRARSVHDGVRVDDCSAMLPRSGRAGRRGSVSRGVDGEHLVVRENHGNPRSARSSAMGGHHPLEQAREIVFGRSSAG